MIGESLEQGLRKQKYEVDWVRDGVAAEAALSRENYALILLDLGLPRLQGLHLLKNYRQAQGKSAVLIITARDTRNDKVEGLDAGADDYLIKPFDLEELFARLRALLRRSQVVQPAELSHQGLVLRLDTHEALYQGNSMHFSLREFKLLQALLDVPGKVLSRTDLEEKMYSWDAEIESNTVEVYIHSLRKKLGTEFIKNVRGVGYKVANPL
ncbi:Two-component system response regulator QseB [Collimonas arenae]|uniref:Two-component system response regulator QseB n=2 Tax=Collimonas arenae TaxID=279058 RepID=A0A0A1FBL4_9BURK|nr:Two-component system response regulator QseB [Collimonas arenae]